MATIKIKWTVSELSNVLLVYDQVKVYRSTTGYGGSYSEITGPGTRVDLVVDQTLYEYLDTDGAANYWYKTAYYNSGTAEESDASDPILGDTPGLYCSIQDIRDEGFDSTSFSDERVINAIHLASRLIERATGRWFEPRDRDYYLDGSGVGAQPMPAPIIDITGVWIDEASMDLEDLRIYNRHVTEGLEDPDDRNDPRVELYRAYPVALYQGIEIGSYTAGYPYVFPDGQQNVRVTGTFGYTEYDGTTSGKTPALLTHLCVLLVSRELEPISDGYARSGRRDFWRVVQDKTRDQSITLSRPMASPAALLARGMLTGDQEIDSLILAFRKPTKMAAV